MAEEIKVPVTPVVQPATMAPKPTTPLFNAPANTIPQKTPVTTPVNADIDKSKLGLNTKSSQTSTTNAETGAKTTVTTVTTTPTLGMGAGIAVGDVKLGEHIVTIKDFTKVPHKFYDFLIHCNTCGYEERVGNNDTMSLEQAKQVAETHIERKKIHPAKKVADMNTNKSLLNGQKVTPVK